uniref:Replication protein A3 n=1 Tax=Esox lucius TaxID=8010 RepID=A0AAY5LCK3_ESOLU
MRDNFQQYWQNILGWFMAYLINIHVGIFFQNATHFCFLVLASESFRGLKRGLNTNGKPVSYSFPEDVCVCVCVCVWPSNHDGCFFFVWGSYQSFLSGIENAVLFIYCVVSLSKLDEELSGVLEVVGTVSNKGTIMASAYNILREDKGIPFDLELYNEALKVVHDFPQHYPFEIATSG